ncbi:MAG: DNA translocase FtsK 4TM domain-containing protein, partial [Chloroflexi bacterium]|nr:DNA translocase FtsK 4TM domain-containing protein [Chloroflexota bacterium]
MTKRVYRKKRKDGQLSIDKHGLYVLIGIALIAAGVVTLWAYFSTGQSPSVTRWLILLQQSLGWASYLSPVIFIGIGGLLLQQASKHPWRWPWLELTGLFIVLVAALALTNLLADGPLLSCSVSNGGTIGCMLGMGLSHLVGQATAVILCIIGALAGFLLVLHVPFRRVAWALGMFFVWLASLFQRLGFAIANGWHRLQEALQHRQHPITVTAPVIQEHFSETVINSPKPKPLEPAKAEAETVRGSEVEDMGLSLPQGDAADARLWRLPNTRDVLVVRQDSQMNLADIRAKARIIEQTLLSLGVPAKVVEVNPGPVVTQFGIEPGYVERYDRNGEVQLAKVKVSRIAALSNDLALALAASPIRIEAPVPGKGIVGLEVPNGQPATVGLRGVVESPEFAELNSKLAMALGRDVSGTAVVADLLKLPHMLIAGATNSGKSVCLNAIIACFLLHNTPDELRLILVDPKRVELSQYAGIPHLLAPVVVEPDRVLGVLNWLTREMDRRYRAFSAAGTRNIEVFNEACEQRGEAKMPYIVLVMDELADLMIVSPDEVERAICRLAQMS